MSTIAFTGLERRLILTLACIYALRLMGLFMILPVFSNYAIQLQYATPFWIGLALGSYGLTQALFQIPFGYLSDRLGRKPLIMMGLVLFAGGSVVAALSNSIFGIIVGRSLQGIGAIGSVMMALLTDLTREEVRLRAMAGIGITIGLSFALAFVFGPWLAAWQGVKSIFWMTALLAIVATFVVAHVLPNTKHLPHTHGRIPTFKQTFPPVQNLQLNTLYFGVLVLHASLTALFLKIPTAVTQLMEESRSGETWQFYALVFLAALLTTFPILFMMEKNKNSKYPFLLSITCLIVSELIIFFFFDSLPGLGLGLWLFFTAFNILEASLPSSISKLAPPDGKGKALGVFSALQFLGLFLGGFIGGMLDSFGGLIAVLGFCVILALIWFLWVCLFNWNKREREVYDGRHK